MMLVDEEARRERRQHYEAVKSMLDLAWLAEPRQDSLFGPWMGTEDQHMLRQLEEEDCLQVAEQRLQEAAGIADNPDALMREVQELVRLRRGEPRQRAK